MKEARETRYFFVLLFCIVIFGMLAISSANGAASETVAANVVSSKAVLWTDTTGGDHGGADWTPANKVEIAGNHTNIGTFTIAAGTTVYVKTYDGTNYGNISIQANNIIINGTLNGDGRGYHGGYYNYVDGYHVDGFGPGGGGQTGGGGYGGEGGYGIYGAGGSTYGGLSTYTIEMGSGGGGSTGNAFHGGAGGGTIMLQAANNIIISGAVSAVGNGGGLLGAGSGGGILIDADNITIGGVVKADGGDAVIPYCVGGGGGGGRIKIFNTTNQGMFAGTISANGGPGSNCPGGIGTVYFSNDKPRIKNILPCSGVYSNSVNISIVGTQTSMLYDIEAYYGGIWHTLITNNINTYYIWNTTSVTEQVGVDIRARVKDSVGYVSVWYNPAGTNITIDHTLPTTNCSQSGSMGSNGWYVSNLEINLTATDNLSSINYTEYKIDTWITYTSNFTISTDGTYTVYYRSVDGAGNVEVTKSVGFKIDKTAPQTQVYPINPVAPYVTSVPFNVLWGGLDNTTGIQYYDVEYKVGLGAGWQSFAYHTTDTSANFYALLEGQTVYLRCRATDNAGNVEDWPTSNEGDVNVTVDCTPPTTSHIFSGSMGSNSWYISNVEITLSAFDSVSGMNYTEYRINSGAWTIYTDTFTPEDDGTHIIYYCSVDKAGNAEYTKCSTVKIDKTSPITTPSLSGTMGNNEWFVSSVEVSLSAVDCTSGVDVIKYSWDTTFYTYSPCSKPNKDIGGVYTIFYYAVDLAGNQGTTNSLSFKIDKTAPTTSHSVAGTQGNSDWYISDVAIMLIGTDTGSEISQTYYQINNGVTQSGTSIALTQSGTYTVKYWSVDNAGNSELDLSTTIKIDKGKPIVSLGSPAEGEIVITNMPTISWSGSDEDSQISYYEVQVDNNNNFASPEFTKTTADTATATISLPDGSYYWRVRAVDNANNVGEWQSRSFSISVGPPTNLTIKINSGAQFTNSTQVTLTLSASQNTVEMCFSNDNSTWSLWEAFANTKGMDLSSGDGEKKVYFKCRNLYGNESEVVSDTIILDMISPITIDNAPGGWQVVKPVTVALTSTDNTSGVAHTYYKVWLIGTTEPDWSEGTAVTITQDGKWYVKYCSIDNAGNIETSKTVEVLIDTVAPTTTDNAPIGWTNTTVTVTLIAADTTSRVAHTYYKLWLITEPEPSSYTEGTAILIADNGKWYIEYYSVDIAENTETCETKEIWVDTVPPSTTDDVPTGWQTSSLTTTLTATDTSSGIETTYYKLWLDNTSEPGWAIGNSIAITSDGIWNVKYFSIDNAGNLENATEKQVFVDTIPPTTTDNIPSGWVNKTITVNLTPTDATSGMARTYYKLWVAENAESSEYTEGTMVFVSTDGKWYIKYYSEDIANNREVPKQKELWLDTISPSLQIIEPQDGLITNKENITVKGTVSDLNGIESADILVNDSSYFIALVDGNFSQVVKLSNGTNIIILKAKDPAQNQAEISITITYDPTIPTLIIYTPTNNSITNISQCTVKGKTEPEYTITVCGINTPVNDTGRFARTVILTEGLNIISVTVTNPAGTKTTIFVYIMLDTIAPITAHDIAGDQGSNNWYISDVAITLNVTDSTTTVIQTRYRINNDSWLNYTAPFTMIADSVCYTVDYYSVDTAGNVEAVKSFYFKLDKTPPVTTHDLIGTEGVNGWYNSTVTLILTASDGTSNIASIKYRENNGSWCDYILCNTSFNVKSSAKKLSVAEYIPTPIFSDGEYFIEYYSIDCAGNHEAIKSALFKTDTTPPEPPKDITISPTAWTNINSFSIDWNNQSDIAGIAGTWYKIGSRPIHNQDGTFTYQKPLAVSAPADGSYAVYVWLQDKAGNANYQFSATAYIKLDTTIPQTTLLKIGTRGNENWYISEVTVEFSVLDRDSGLKATYYSFENSEYQLYTSAFNIIEDGIYSIKYYSIDNAGNIELEATADIKIDKEKPTTNATKEGAFGNADWFTSNVTVVLKSYDEISGISACYWSINNTDYQQYTAQIILSQEGAHTIRYYSTDTAGNIELEKELSVRIDKTPPTTTVLTQGLLGNDDWYVTPLTFSLISQDTVSGIKKTEYEINQGIWEEYTGPITFQDGIYTINYFAVNNADTQEKLQSIVVKVDHTAPITNISAGRYSVKGGEVLFANSTIKFFAEDDTSGVKEIKYCINNSVWRSYCEPIFLEDGIYTIQYYSIDFAGNTEYSNTKTIIIGEKMLVPIVEITYPTERAELGGNVSVSYTACSILNKTLLVTVKFLYNAGEIIIAESIAPEDEVKFSTVRMENGVYILRIIAVDSDGRMGYKEINVSVNNKMILEISVPSGIVPNSVVQITAEMCNYLRSNECFAAEFYFDDLYIGCNQTSILKIFEKEKLSLSYKVNSTTEHCISVKLFTKNRQLLEEKKIYFAVASVAEEQSNKQAGFNFLQFSIPVFMCACFGILYISRKRKISSWKVPQLKRTNPSCTKTSQVPYSGNPLKSPEEVQRMIAEYKNKLRGEKNE